MNAEPIDKLLEWMDNAVAFMENQLETDEEIKSCEILTSHYSGLVSGYRITRAKAREIKQNTSEND